MEKINCEKGMFLHAKLYLANASRSRASGVVNGHHISLVAGVMLMSLSSALASSSSWNFLLHQNVEHTGGSLCLFYGSDCNELDLFLRFLSV